MLSSLIKTPPIPNLPSKHPAKTNHSIQTNFLYIQPIPDKVTFTGIPENKSHPEQTNPTGILSIDYDGTSKGHFRDIATLQEGPFGNKFFVHLNTARGLTSLRYRAEEFKELYQLNAISTNNGEGLYINTNNEPPYEWLLRLTVADQSGKWIETQERETGWNNQQVSDIISNIVEQCDPSQVWTYKTFAHTRTIPNFGPKSIWDNHDGTEYLVKLSPERPQAFYDAFAENILSALRKQNINAYCEVEPDADRHDHNIIKYQFFPADYDKATPLRFLAKNFPHLKGAIVSGDGPKDLSLLSLHHIETEDGTEIPVFPIAITKNPTVREAIKNSRYPGIITVEDSSQISDLINQIQSLPLFNRIE